MNTVFVVEHNNGEPYEDNYSWLGDVFSTKEAAFKYLEDVGFVERKYHNEFSRSSAVNRGIVGSFVTPKSDEYVGWGENEFAEVYEKKVID